MNRMVRSPSALIASAAIMLTAALAGCSAPVNAPEGSAPASESSAATEAEDRVAEAEAAPGSASGTGVDVCAIYGLDDINAETGRQYARIGGGTEEEAALSVCNYQGPTDELADLMVFTIYVYPDGGAAAMADYADRVGTYGSSPVSGIGVEALGGPSDLLVRFDDDTVVAVIDTVFPEGVESLSPVQFSTIAEAVHAAL